MTATITRLATPGRKPDIAGHLRDLSPHAVGMLERMREKGAVRHFVQAIAQRHPLNDAGGRADVWAQVEDVCSHAPALTSTTGDLETYVHALRSVLSVVRPDRLASAQGIIGGRWMRISVLAARLRLAVDTDNGRRLIDFRLERDGAYRIGDRMAGS